MTENCHMLKVHLEKLVSARHLNQYIDADLSDKKEPSQIHVTFIERAISWGNSCHPQSAVLHCLFGVL